MKFLVTFLLLVGACTGVSAQKLDSIFFDLYTDSLKKGTFNYINVVGKFNNGSYLPLSNGKDLKFTASAGKFNGNSLYIDSSFKEEKVIVRAFVPGNTALRQEQTIYIKKYENAERLPTMQEVLNGSQNKDSSPRSRKRSRKR